MLERELQWERGLFFFLNGSDSSFWDSFFYFYSYKWTWIPFYLCFLFVFIYRKTGTEIKRDWKEILGTIFSIVIVVVLCDQISSGIFKPVFHRFRPTHHPDFQNLVDIVRGERGGQYGFISSHAANMFGLATFTASLFRNRLFTVTIFVFALLTGYSRIYLGLHFVSDVVVGALVGMFIGYIVYRIQHIKVKNSIYPEWKIYLLCSVYLVSVVFLFIFS
ncbi:lipid A 4'-phosphatase [Bacteroidia bacterium]|nr:lipid A 4'-phosphatase [Bacteroidia bacterium]